MRITEAFIAERDNRAYELRKAGASYRQIAAALSVSESTAHAAVQRAIKKINQRFALDHAAELQLEVERLDDLMRQLWPLTRPQEVETGDFDASGNPVKVKIPPNMDAVDRVLKIAAQRAKLLGLDSIKISVDHGGPQAPELGGGQKAIEKTPKEEALTLLKELEKAGIIEGAVSRQIRKQVGAVDEGEIIDAVVVGEDVDLLELESGEAEDEPPPWVEDDDDDEISPPWRP